MRPDTFYGVSKVAGEALGCLYWERHGLKFVAVRICSFQPRPQNARHLSTWLSPRDAVQLFRWAVTAPGVAYLTVAVISGNIRRWITPEGWDVLGYTPQDDAEEYAGRQTRRPGQPHRDVPRRRVYRSPLHRAGRKAGMKTGPCP